MAWSEVQFESKAQSYQFYSEWVPKVLSMLDVTNKMVKVVEKGPKMVQSLCLSSGTIVIWSSYFRDGP